jgi:hypothetical protein
VSSSLFHPKKIGFSSIILQNGTKHHAKFLTKRHSFFILDFGLKRQKKKPKSSHPPHKKFGILVGTNTPMKILAFCISSFQNNWYFAFNGELNTALVHDWALINKYNRKCYNRQNQFFRELNTPLDRIGKRLSPEGMKGISQKKENIAFRKIEQSQI